MPFPRVFNPPADPKCDLWFRPLKNGSIFSVPNLRCLSFQGPNNPGREDVFLSTKVEADRWLPEVGRCHHLPSLVPSAVMSSAGKHSRLCSPSPGEPSRMRGGKCWNGPTSALWPFYLHVCDSEKHSDDCTSHTSPGRGEALLFPWQPEV